MHHCLSDVGIMCVWRAKDDKYSKQRHGRGREGGGLQLSSSSGETMCFPLQQKNTSGLIPPPSLLYRPFERGLVGLEQLWQMTVDWLPGSEGGGGGAPRPPRCKVWRWKHTVGWSDFNFLRFSKMGTLLSIRYIFVSLIPKKSFAASAWRSRGKMFLFLNHRELKN